MKNWTLSTDPQDYLERWPDGPNAELARSVLGLDEEAAEEVEVDDTEVEEVEAEAEVDDIEADDAVPPPQDPITPPRAADLPEIGGVVNYHDTVSGWPRDARVSGHNDDRTLELALFTKRPITRPLHGVAEGTGPGQWSRK